MSRSVRLLSFSQNRSRLALSRVNNSSRGKLRQRPAGVASDQVGLRSWRHGMRAREWIEVRAEINELVREAREFELLI